MLSQLFLAQYPPHDSYPAKSIAEQYRKWDAAYLSRDERLADDVLSKRFTLTTGSGTVRDKQTYLVTFGDSPAPATYTTELLRVKHRGQEIQAWTRETSDGETHWYLDTWVRERGMWRLLKSRTLREEH